MTKLVLKQTYSSTLSKILQQRLESTMAEETVISHLENLSAIIEPDPSIPINPDRTEDDIAETRLKAKRLLTQGGSLLESSLDTISKVLGKYTVVLGMSRLFNMLQEEELNLMLICQLLDTLVQTLLTP
jgi:hypothetical protein